MRQTLQQHTHIAAAVDLDKVLAHSSEARIGKLPVIEQARRIARRTRSALTLLCFQSPPSLISNLQSLVTRQDTAEGQLDVRYTLFSLARTIEQEDGISVRCEGLRVAYSPSVLADWLGSTSADLLLLPKPDRQGAVTTTLNGLSELIRQTGLPVWFVDQESRPQEGVVVAVSEGAEEASGELRALDYEVMDVARGVGALFQSPLHLVQAAEDSRAVRERSLESFARATGAAQEVDEILVADGDVPAVVAGSAESLQAGLIIMGASDRNGWDRVMRGGTAESTLNRASCDVLYVKNAAGEYVRPQAVLSHAAMEEVP
jgi:nucleotide-binding universal stress UspA family protein